MTGSGQPGFKPNYDESKVPKYELPDPFKLRRRQGGRRRHVDEEAPPEILGLFETHVYGTTPAGRPKEHDLRGHVDRQEGPRRQGDPQGGVRSTSPARRTGPKMDLLHLPARNAKGPVPVFLGLNFSGNHAVHTDPGITLSTSWMRNDPSDRVVDNRATEKSRGSEASRVAGRGDPRARLRPGDDLLRRHRSRLRRRLPERRPSALLQAGQTRPAADEWGSIAAWAWGLSRALDYLETDRGRRREAGRRHGPFAAGQDGAVGRGAGRAVRHRHLERLRLRRRGHRPGASSARRRRASTRRSRTGSATTSSKYNDKEDELPVDQHMLIALIAPRPVLRRQRRGRPLGRPARRVPLRPARRPGLQAARHRRPGRDGDARR